MFNQEFIDERYRQLLTERKELETSLEGVAEYDDDSQAYRPVKPDYGDSADADDYEADDFQEVMAKVARVNDVLKKIESALKKITAGTYGKCATCDKMMEEEHLKAVPWSESCPECAS